MKEAFARRCEELKADNNALVAAAAEYKQQMLEGYSSGRTETKSRIKRFRKEDSPQSQLPITPQFKDSQITKLIKEKLGISPADSS